MNSVNLTRGLVVLFWLALAFTLGMALLPAPPKALLIGGDKTLHVTAFVALTLLARLAFRHRRLIDLFVALAVIGGLIEVLQIIPVFQRDAELADWIADCAAIAVTLGVVKFVQMIEAARTVASIEGA